MKPATLTLHNFMGYADLEIDLSRPVNVIQGKNNSGKSTIAEALEFVLLGTARGTDAGGKGAHVLIGAHGDTASVTLTLADGREATRTANGKGTDLEVPWVMGTKAMKQDGLLQQLRVSADQLRAVLRASTFLDLGQEAQASLLASLVDMRVEVADLFAEVEKAGAEEADTAYLGRFFGADAKPLDAKAFERLYQALYEARAGAKKKASDAEPESNGDGLSAQGALDAQARVNQISAEITKMVAREKELVASTAVAGDRRKRLDAAQERLGALNESTPRSPLGLMEDTSVLESDLEGFKEACAEAAADVGKTADLLEEAADECDEANAALEAATADYEKARAEVVRLEAGTCPTCNRPLAESKAVLVAMKREAKAAGLKASEIHRIATEDTTRTAAKLGDAKAAHERASIHERNLIASLNDAQTRLTRALDENSRLKGLNETAIERHEEAIRAQQTIIEELGDAEVAGDDDAELNELTDQLTLKRGRLDELKQKLAAHTSRQERLTKHAALKVEVASLERLCALLAPKNLPAKMTAARVEPFLGRVNERLAQVAPGIELAIEAGDKGLVLLYHTADSRWLPVCMLSGSEKVRVGACFAEAVSVVTGAKLLVIDQGDILDDENRAAFWSFLGDVVGDHDSILVMATGMPKAASTEMVGYWVCGAGHLSLVEVPEVAESSAVPG